MADDVGSDDGDVFGVEELLEELDDGEGVDV